MCHKTLRWFLICRKINITERGGERGGGGGGGEGGGRGDKIDSQSKITTA